MSQKSEKYARHLSTRMDKLEQDCRFVAALHSISDDTATELRRRTREKARLARQWRQRCMWLAVVAATLAVALCLTLKVKADAALVEEPPIESIPIVAVAQEDFENEKIEVALLESANVIENCAVTWYTADTCGKHPGDPAYGITYSGLPVVEGLSCAVDPDVIPLYSDVFVEYADGMVEQLWATDTGVKGNAIDIYTSDYDYAIQCGRQSLTVWWVGP
ncbi:MULTISPECIES: 3D domain-containing protein [unclassified Oscillibacter]|uniref:3D domain-containing protein n=1 Tax=unclassified Oscillibacter TaxID=2629304 RepID=UPI0025FEF6E5|nr:MULTISPECIES: 3D domain-containing protein [unclassified Oscillibacter]